jgi:hypothetical protein
MPRSDASSAAGPGVLIGAMVGAWLSVILAAGAFAVELSAGGRGGFLTVSGWMTLVHAAIGLGEALHHRGGRAVRPADPTGPDHAPDPAPAPAARWGQVAVAGLAAALAVAVFLAPFASRRPTAWSTSGSGWGSWTRRRPGSRG